MAARKSPGRDLFDESLAQYKPDLPPTYSTMVLLKIMQPAMLARIKDPAVLNKIKSPDRKVAGQYINQVVKGQTVDFVVLDAIKKVAEECRAVRQPATV